MRFKTFYLQETENAIPKILYHGSNYDFSKFDLKFVGKGEGLQKFGYGIYLTDTEELSNFYATQLKGTQIIYQCRIPSDSRLYEWGSPVDDYLHNKYIRYLNDNDFEKDAEKLQDEYEQYNEYMEFENYYKILSHLVGSPKKSSEIFVDLGVDGCISDDIKNRGKIYVIFDASLIKIIDKEILNESGESLNEASQEYNIAKVLADKIIKRLRDISYSAEKYPERHKSTKTNKWIGTHKIPMSEFLKDLNYPKGGVFDSLKDGHVYLDYGYLDIGNKTPYLNVFANGKLRKASGYFSAKDEKGIHLPFINSKTDLPFEDYFEDYHSLILHELTHYVQEYKNKTTKGTADLSTEEWFKNEKEKEAYLHELYRNLQNYVKDIIGDMKSYRSSEYKSPEYKKYVIKSNKLKKLFESLETFKKSIRMDIAEIFYTNPKNRDRFLYLSTELRDVYNKFLEDSYSELKKEFKNMIPTKELKYEKES